MKIRMEIDDCITDDEIIIRCKELNDEIKNISENILINNKKIEKISNGRK